MFQNKIHFHLSWLKLHIKVWKCIRLGNWTGELNNISYTVILDSVSLIILTNVSKNLFISFIKKKKKKLVRADKFVVHSIPPKIYQPLNIQGEKAL